ncbi:unnamed protein product [Dibothriocephalus latus]|uniref:CCHC-type domain-containing protein n=1 Tax=Dibothriocephalus latus TaxID=60516 RepID=A0A3P7NK19_DIBLA|nr:unnamed protein product [Dibothriocephalus latus]
MFSFCYLRQGTLMQSEKSSLFSIRYQCLKLVKNEADDFLPLASTFNRECEKFKLRERTDDQFKCLIFMSALQAPRDAEIRTRLLSKIEQDLDSTLQTLTAECQQLKNLKHDSAIVEQPSSSFAAANVHAVIRTKSISPQKSQDPTPRKPPSACWQCGDWHFARFCPFKKPVCHKCHKRGHKEDHCPAGQPLKSKAGNRKAGSSKRPSSYCGLKSNSIQATFQTEISYGYHQWQSCTPLAGHGIRHQPHLQTHLADDWTASDDHIG